MASRSGTDIAFLLTVSLGAGVSVASSKVTRLALGSDKLATVGRSGRLVE